MKTLERSDIDRPKTILNKCDLLKSLEHKMELVDFKSIFQEEMTKKKQKALKDNLDARKAYHELLLYILARY